MRLCWILMNYFKEDELVSFVRLRLLASEFEGFVVHVVDNGSGNRALLEELRRDPRVRIHGSGENLGYFGGAALAVKEHVKEYGEVAELTVVSNFDLEWNDGNMVQSLYENSVLSPYNVLAPRITDVKTSVEMNPYYRERIGLSKLNRLIYITSFYPLYLIYQWLHKLKRAFSSSSTLPEDTPVYAVHGSFVVFKKEYFQQSAGLQFGSFLYGEELFVAEECRRCSLSTGVLSSLHVYHREHITTGTVKNSKHMKYLHESLRYIKNTYFRA